MTVLPTGAPRSVLVLYASVGAGHERPARHVAARLAAAGHAVTALDLAEAAWGGRVLREAFHRMLLRRPDRWGRICARFDDTGRLPAAMGPFVAAAGRTVARIVQSRGVGLVISTYPLAGRVVARARRATGMRLPLATYVTDPAVHGLWLDGATDRYLVTWSFIAANLAGRTRVPISLVAPQLSPSVDRVGAGRILPLAAGYDAEPAPGCARPQALVASGSWGVGEMLQTVRDVAADGRFTPLVACGRNERLRAAVAAVPGAVALGWVDDLPTIARTCAVAVLNSGGLTLAEMAAAGVPVVHHRPLPGQGELNAAACLVGAAVPVSRTAAELSAALGRAVDLNRYLGTDDPAAAALDTPPSNRQPDAAGRIFGRAPVAAS